MTISNIPGSYRAASTIAAPRVKASEEGLFKPITAKVSGALSDEYIQRIKDQARADAAKGSYMDGYDGKQRTGFSAMRDAQMKQYVSPDRNKAISQVSTAINTPNRVWKSGANLLDLLSIPYTARIFNGPVYGTTAEIYNADGEMIAGYSNSYGWTSVPTADETRFQYESNQIYREAYNAAKAEITNAVQQTAAPAAVSGGATGSFDVKA